MKTWTRALSRRRRALCVSSPIGLGHAQRDVAIAGELRKLHPDLEIGWLAQHPVTVVLEAAGERIHVAHRLDRYRAGRRMDYATADPDAIAAALAAELGRAVDYRPVETDGAARAASLIAELV